MFAGEKRTGFSQKFSIDHAAKFAFCIILRTISFYPLLKRAQVADFRERHDHNTCGCVMIADLFEI